MNELLTKVTENLKANPTEWEMFLPHLKQAILLGSLLQGTIKTSFFIMLSELLESHHPDASVWLECCDKQLGYIRGDIPKWEEALKVPIEYVDTFGLPIECSWQAKLGVEYKTTSFLNWFLSFATSIKVFYCLTNKTFVLTPEKCKESFQEDYVLSDDATKLAIHNTTISMRELDDVELYKLATTSLGNFHAAKLKLLCNFVNDTSSTHDTWVNLLVTRTIPLLLNQNPEAKVCVGDVEHFWSTEPHPPASVEAQLYELGCVDLPDDHALYFVSDILNGVVHPRYLCTREISKETNNG